MAEHDDEGVDVDPDAQVEAILAYVAGDPTFSRVATRQVGSPVNQLDRDMAMRVQSQIYYDRFRQQPVTNSIGAVMRDDEVERFARVICTLRALGWSRDTEEVERRQMAEEQRDRMHKRLTTTSGLYMTAMRQFTNAMAQVVALERELSTAKLLLASSVLIAQDAAAEWDEAPEGMKAGKILLALAGHVKGYRPDTDAIHEFLKPVPTEDQSTTGTA